MKGTAHTTARAEYRAPSAVRTATPDDVPAIGRMIRELAELYDASVDGREAMLPALTTDYADTSAIRESTLEAVTAPAGLRRRHR